MINLIANGFFDDVLQSVLQNVAKKIEINYACITYYKETFDRLKIKKIDWIQYPYYLLGQKSIFKCIDQNELIPLDQDLITKMSNCERIVLRMIDRLEFNHKYSYDDRVRMYHFLLRYFNHIIETKKINLYILTNVPHEVYDYVIYDLCKLKNIPVIFLYHQAQIEDTCLLMHDWRENSVELRDHLVKLKKTYSHANEQDIKLSPRFETHYKRQVTNSAKAVPFYVKKKGFFGRVGFFAGETVKFVARTFVRLFRQSFRITVFETKNTIEWIYRRYTYHRFFRDRYLNWYYRRVSVRPDLRKPYIYVPLQYQPEHSTTPLADAFTDQVLILQMISKFLPEDIKLYIKEYPIQTSLCRSKKYYQDMLKVKNVVFVRKDVSSFDLINNSLAVATATGTPGWEALFREKPVLMFGSYIYQFADGVFKVKTNEDCKKALEEIIHKHVKPTLKQTRIFLKALEDVSTPAVVDPEYLRVTKLDEKENIRNLSGALIEEIKKTVRSS